MEELYQHPWLVFSLYLFAGLLAVAVLVTAFNRVP